MSHMHEHSALYKHIFVVSNVSSPYSKLLMSVMMHESRGFVNQVV